MGSQQQLVSVFDLAGVEGVVEDPPDRCGGEKARFAGLAIVAVAKPMHIPCAEALGVHPTGHLAKRGGAGGVAAEQFLDCFGFLFYQMHSAGMLRFAG